MRAKNQIVKELCSGVYSSDIEDYVLHHIYIQPDKKYFYYKTQQI